LRGAITDKQQHLFFVKIKSMCAPNCEKHEGTPPLKARGVPWRPLAMGSSLELLYLLFSLGLALACIIPSLPAPGKATSYDTLRPQYFSDLRQFS
jgi:hypothetical protein